jgi:hypothetical protein
MFDVQEAAEGEADGIAVSDKQGAQLDLEKQLEALAEQ